MKQYIVTILLVLMIIIGGNLRKQEENTILNRDKKNGQGSGNIYKPHSAAYPGYYQSGELSKYEGKGQDEFRVEADKQDHFVCCVSN